LFFTDALMESYIDSNGKPLGKDAIFTTDYAGRKSVRTPTVIHSCGSTSSRLIDAKHLLFSLFSTHGCCDSHRQTPLPSPPTTHCPV
jgi:hypothetical protein